MMEKSDHKLGKVFLVFAGICVIALPFVVLSALSFEPKEIETPLVAPGGLDFDQKGKAVFETFDRMSGAYLAGTSTERTLSEYYARRQYAGAPPYIPHELEDTEGAEMKCLTCHARGGWAAELKRYTPVTPHPEQVACRQCHVRITTDTQFVASDWLSLPPPRLGGSYLPGAPPPIPHDLQMRGDCVACHVGPGAVTAIRVDHPMRGNCRQCHVPDTYAEPFQRKPKS